MTEPTPDPAAPAAPKKTADAGTGYMVLSQDKPAGDAPPRWLVVGTNLTARSAEHAVRLYAEKLETSQTPRVLVAVPSRSWRPVTVSAKVTTALVIEGVDA